MPRLPAHLAFAVPCSLLAYGACSEGQPARLDELVGVILGWYAGARVPDLLDPPTSGHHRAFAHSGLAVLALIKTKPADWVQDLRARAVSYETAAASTADTRLRANLQLWGLLYRLAAGFVPAFIGGYASHLFLDAMTSKGLPVAWLALLGLVDLRPTEGMPGIDSASGTLVPIQSQTAVDHQRITPILGAA
jgi:hypothetical protein